MYNEIYTRRKWILDLYASSISKHSNICVKIFLTMSKCPTLPCLSISDKGHPPYCSVSSCLNSGMFPLNCPYMKRHVFGEIAEVSHVNRFPLRQTHFSLLSYFSSLDEPTLTCSSRSAWPLSHFLCSDSRTAQQELVSLFMMCSFVFDSLSYHLARPGTLPGVNCSTWAFLFPWVQF